MCCQIPRTTLKATYGQVISDEKECIELAQKTMNDYGPEAAKMGNILL